MNPWIRISGRHPMPEVRRYRTEDGDYALRIECWHGQVGHLAYPVQSTVENWERYVWLNPCRWVQSCPRFADLQDPEASRQSATEGFVDLVRPEARGVKVERNRRKGIRTRGEAQ
jgi:hypothetical protein